jgi:hypothetical protein
MTPKEIIRQGYRDGTPVRRLAEILGLSRAAIKQRAQRDKDCPPHGGFLRNVIIDTEAHSQGEEAMKEATKAEVDALREHCAEHKLPFGNHRLWWHKTKEFSVSFYDAEQVEKEKKMQAEFLARIKKQAPKSKKPPVPSKTLAIPANFDVHIGKHCERIRTGREYTPDMAVEQVLKGQRSLYAMTIPFDVTDILLPLGNDIVHIDSNANTTSSGTPQDAYGSVESQMYLAAELYIRSIEMFARNNNVWLCHVHSNHDRVAGWSVSQMVARYFHDHPRVHAAADSMSQQHRKYFVFGENLIMFHHGEAKEEKLLGIIKAEANKALAETNRIYCYQGHTHHKTVSKRGLNTDIGTEKDHSALTVIKSGNGAVNQLHVETVRSPSPADDWHSRSQFVNMPAVEMFLHSDQAQFGRFTHWF